MKPKAGFRTMAATRALRDPRGTTMIELVIAFAITALTTLISLGYTLDWLRSETAKGAVYEIQTQIQLARMEAVSRNHDCRFIIDTQAKTMAVIDRADSAAPFPGGPVLHSARLDKKVEFVDPEGGPPVTLSLLSGTTYEATFSPTGVVASGGDGMIFIEGGERSRRLHLLTAGGLQVQHRQDGLWLLGP